MRNFGSYKKPYGKDSGGQSLLLKGLDNTQKKIQKIVSKLDESSNFSTSIHISYGLVNL